MREPNVAITRFGPRCIRAWPVWLNNPLRGTLDRTCGRLHAARRHRPHHLLPCRGLRMLVYSRRHMGSRQGSRGAAESTHRRYIACGRQPDLSRWVGKREVSKQTHKPIRFIAGWNPFGVRCAGEMALNHSQILVCLLFYIPALGQDIL